MEKIVAFGKLVSDPTRLKIIKLLIVQPLCVCELMEVLKINQSCISQHLTILKQHQLLKSQREGKWVVYEIDSNALNRFLKEINKFCHAPLATIATLKQSCSTLNKLRNKGLLRYNSVQSLNKHE